MSQFCAKAEKGKKSFSHYLPALFLYPPYSPSVPSTSTPLHFSRLQPPPQSVFIATRQLYLPSNGTIWFIGWGWLKDPLLLLWRQCGVQRDDFDITNIRPQVVDLPLDSLAGFVNFLKDGGATINPALLVHANGKLKHVLNNTWVNNGSESG